MLPETTTKAAGLALLLTVFIMPIDQINKTRKAAAETVEGAVGLAQSVGEDLKQIATVVSLGKQAVDLHQANGAQQVEIGLSEVATISEYGTAADKKRAVQISKTGTRNDLRRLQADVLRRATNAPESGIEETPAPVKVKDVTPTRASTQARKNNYQGPCPYMTVGGITLVDSRGNPCGRRAASIRPGGFGG